MTVEALVFSTGEKLVKVLGGSAGVATSRAVSAAVIGWCSSRLLMDCGAPSSITLKSDGFKPVTGRPEASVTSTSSNTSRVVTESVVTDGCEPAGACCASTVGPREKRARTEQPKATRRASPSLRWACLRWEGSIATLQEVAALL